MTTLSTNLLGRKLFERISSDKEVNGSFSGMTLHQFLIRLVIAIFLLRRMEWLLSIPC